MYQDPADTNTGIGSCPQSGNSGPQLGGNTGSFFNGVLYFPKDQLQFSGNSKGTNLALTLTDSLCLSGNPVLNLQGAAGLPQGVTLNTITEAILVE